MDIQFYKQFYKNSPIAYTCQQAIFDGNGTPIDYIILDCNESYEKMMGINVEQIKDKRYYDIFPNGWENQQEWNDFVIEAVVNKKSAQFDINRYTIQKWIRIINFPIDGAIFGCIYYDVTKEYMLDHEVEGFLKVNIDMLCVSSTDGYFLRVNEAFERILGYKVEELEGKSFMDLVHLEDLSRTSKIVKDLVNQKYVSSFVNRVLRKDGTYRYLEWHSQPNGNYVYSSARDITKRRKLEQELFEKNESLAKLTEELKQKNELLKTLAITDDLTGLYNRHYLDMKIGDEINHADRVNQPLSMIIIDMDFFKEVNDTWGHPVGDDVLKKTAGILKGIVRKSDILVRLGGEEFIIILNNTTIEEAYLIAERIRKTIEQYKFPTAGFLTASLGVAAKEKNEAFNSWYGRTDLALYKAKGKKRNCVVKSSS